MAVKDELENILWDMQRSLYAQDAFERGKPNTEGA